MIAALLFAAAPVAMTPLDAERAFIADARTIGQWTAFRKWAAPDAIFLPPVLVSEALKDAKDPPKSVEWWPTASFQSCDGMTAVNTGGAIWPTGRNSRFSTVWRRQSDGGWRWVLDRGNDVATPIARPGASGAVVRRADCATPPTELANIPTAGHRTDTGRSADGSLVWNWSVAPDGSHTFNVALWIRDRFETVLRDKAPPPKPAAE